MKLGIDVGSTTVKLVLLNAQDEILYQKYERHMSSVFDKVRDLLIQMQQEMGEMDVQVVITGSGGLALADKIGAKFSLVLGDDEILNYRAKLKNMATGETVEISLDEDLSQRFLDAQIDDTMTSIMDLLEGGNIHG